MEEERNRREKSQKETEPARIQSAVGEVPGQCREDVYLPLSLVILVPNV